MVFIVIQNMKIKNVTRSFFRITNEESVCSFKIFIGISVVSDC